MALSRPDLLRLLESLRSADRLELVRSVAERMLQEQIESEAAARIGAEWTEHTEARTAYRNRLLRPVTAVLFKMHDQGIAFPRRYLPEGSIEEIYAVERPHQRRVLRRPAHRRCLRPRGPGQRPAPRPPVGELRDDLPDPAGRHRRISASGRPPVVINHTARNTDSTLGSHRPPGNRAHLTWGAGPHSYPARSHACLIAEAAILHVVDALPVMDLDGHRDDVGRFPPFHRCLVALPVTFPTS